MDFVGRNRRILVWARFPKSLGLSMLESGVNTFPLAGLIWAGARLVIASAAVRTTTEDNFINRVSSFGIRGWDRTARNSERRPGAFRQPEPIGGKYGEGTSDTGPKSDPEHQSEGSAKCCQDERVCCSTPRSMPKP